MSLTDKLCVDQSFSAEAFWHCILYEPNITPWQWTLVVKAEGKQYTVVMPKETSRLDCFQMNDAMSSNTYIVFQLESINTNTRTEKMHSSSYYFILALE